MRVSDRNSRSNLVWVEIEGRSHPSIKCKRSNTVLIQKNEPITYTVEELRKIKGEVENIAKYEILGAEVCYRIRKLRLNRWSGEKRKLNKQEVKEERGVLKTNLIEIKTRKSLGLDKTNRKFTLILSNVQFIKQKLDIITDLLNF